MIQRMRARRDLSTADVRASACSPRFERARRRTGTLAALGVGLGLILAACGGDADEASEAADLTAESSVQTTDSVDPTTETSTEGQTLPTPAPNSIATTTTSQATTSSESSTPADTGVDSSSTTSAVTRPGPEGVDCSTACNLVLEGDSLFHSYVDTLCTELGTLTCVNSGIVGHRVDQMVETARADVDIHLGSGANDVLVLWAGTNDLWQKFHSADPTENATKTYDWMTTYLDERRANGWDYLFVMTLPPANPDIIQGDDRLNDLIRANGAGADAVIDVAADTKLADPFDPVLKAVDGVHYTDPGRWLVLFDHLSPAVKSLGSG